MPRTLLLTYDILATENEDATWTFSHPKYEQVEPGIFVTPDGRVNAKGLLRAEMLFGAG